VFHWFGFCGKSEVCFSLSVEFEVELTKMKVELLRHTLKLKNPSRKGCFKLFRSGKYNKNL
jgi:hypothetical protein